MMQTNLQLDLAFNYLENTGTNIFLTGKAGTGKTTFLKCGRGNHSLLLSATFRTVYTG